MPWHVAFTKPLHEADTEAKLVAEGAGVWVARQSVKLANRQKVTRLLFPRYVFVQMTGERERWGCIIRSARHDELATVIRDPAGRPLIVPDDAMAILWQQCGTDGMLIPPPVREVHRGDTVKVIDGPFASFRAVVELTTRDRLTVLLSILGRSTRAEFKRDAVELVA